MFSCAFFRFQIIAVADPGMGRGVNPWAWLKIPNIWEDFCRKQHGNERHWTPSSLDPPMHRQQYFFPKRLLLSQQECIPVGCAPSAAVAICWGGGCLLRGMVSAQRGVCLRGSVCPGGCLPEGWCLPGGRLPGGGVSQHALRQTPHLSTE